MQRPARRPLRLEALEQRETPTVNVSVLSTAVFVRGVPDGDLTVTGSGTPGSYQFTIADGGTVLGTYSLGGSLNIQLSSRPGRVEVDLAGGSIGGSLLIDLGVGGTGDPAVSEVEVYDSTAVGSLSSGTIYGNLTILKGNGNETVRVGAEAPDAAPGAENVRPISIRGGLTASGKSNTYTIDRLALGEGSEVRGNVGISYYDDVTLGLQDVTMASPTVIGGTVNVTLAGATQGLTVNLYGTASRSVSINGSSSTPGFNSVTLAPADPGVDTVVEGNLTVNLGPALTQNQVNILAGTDATTRVVGATTLSSASSTVGTGNDTVVIGGHLYQTARVTLGGGDNDFSLLPTGRIDGSLYYTAANGINRITYEGYVAQLFSLTLGNGDNEIAVSSPIGGKFQLRAGSGDNRVSLLPTGPTLYSLDLRFGNGNNTVTLNENDTVSGLVQGGTGVNVLEQNGATFLPPFSSPYFVRV